MSDACSVHELTTPMTVLYTMTSPLLNMLAAQMMTLLKHAHGHSVSLVTCSQCSSPSSVTHMVSSSTLIGVSTWSGGSAHRHTGGVPPPAACLGKNPQTRVSGGTPCKTPFYPLPPRKWGTRGGTPNGGFSAMEGGGGPPFCAIAGGGPPTDPVTLCA